MRGILQTVFLFCSRLLHPNLFLDPIQIGQALMTEPDNVKALYRRAVVYRLRDQFKWVCWPFSLESDVGGVLTNV